MPSSTEERDAGLNMHGEAHAKPWELRSFRKEGSTTSAAFSVDLPLAQESFTRTFHVVDGENIVWVESELTNLLAFGSTGLTLPPPICGLVYSSTASPST